MAANKRSKKDKLKMRKLLSKQLIEQLNQKLEQSNALENAEESGKDQQGAVPVSTPISPDSDKNNSNIKQATAPIKLQIRVNADGKKVVVAENGDSNTETKQNGLPLIAEKLENAEFSSKVERNRQSEMMSMDQD